MITKEEVLEFLKTEDGLALKTQLITTYIQEDEQGKALMTELMGPELEKAKTEAIKTWETVGKGKGLKGKNTELLAEIATLKEKAKNSDKLQELLDLSGIESYNVLEETVLSIKKEDGNRDEELITLKKDANSARREARENKARVEGLEKERDGFQTAVGDSNSYIAKFLIDNEIKTTLLKQGFDPFQAQGLVSRISQKGKFTVEIDEDTGDRKAVNELGITPEDYTNKDWLTSEEGKAFKPNKAAGGGAGGGSILGGGAKPKLLKDMSWGDRQKMSVDDPEGYEKLKKVSKPST